jgi:hypothetical protein
MNPGSISGFEMTPTQPSTLAQRESHLLYEVDSISITKIPTLDELPNNTQGWVGT